MIPEPYEFALLVLIAGRIWKLIGDDRILDHPRDWLLDRMNDERGAYWGDFLVCPWCAGFWLSGLVYATWLGTLGEWPGDARETIVSAGVWFAVSALVGLYGMTVAALGKLAQ